MSYHHIYNRGAHKAEIFHEKSDYQRMLRLLYIANSIQPFNLAKIRGIELFTKDRRENLIDIVAYCLMPNHIHILAKSRTDLIMDHGITKFMHKLCTGYSMYYNKKYDHSGTIWQGPYKEKIADDEIGYVCTLLNYIHLNPYGIKEPDMNKDARKEHFYEAWQYSINYEYSSLKDYLSEARPRPQKTILCGKEVEKWDKICLRPRLRH